MILHAFTRRNDRAKEQEYEEGDGTPTLTAKEQIGQTADAVASLTVINELKH